MDSFVPVAWHSRFAQKKNRRYTRKIDRRADRQTDKGADRQTDIQMDRDRPKYSCRGMRVG
eukprot:scaffold595106_cov34-Prasinocladus_malaysianus.AAC.1